MSERERQREGEREMFNESNVLCGVCAGGGRRKADHEKPMDRRFKGAGHATYTKGGVEKPHI